MKEEESKKYISVFTITVQHKEKGFIQHVWNKYVSGQYSVASNFIDKDMEKAQVVIMNTGEYKILKAGITCCLPTHCYDPSIVKKLELSDDGCFFDKHPLVA